MQIDMSIHSDEPQRRGGNLAAPEARARLAGRLRDRGAGIEAAQEAVERFNADGRRASPFARAKASFRDWTRSSSNIVRWGRKATITRQIDAFHEMNEF